MDENSAHLSYIADLLHNAIIKIRIDNKIEERDLSSLISSVSQLNDELLKSHLSAIIRSIRNGSFDERSILGKSIRLSRKELKLISDSINEFVENEPFKEMSSKSIMLLWRDILISLIKELPVETEQGD